MYVQKFEADSIDEAIKAVKRELGPDAIILKTIANRGLRGTFKKSKFEITAAIKEENYIQKSRVDRVLNEEQRESFYQAPAKEINDMINRYDSPKKDSSYGSLGLNKPVKALNKEKSLLSKAASSLDDFLNFEDQSSSKNESNNSKSYDEYFEERSADKEVSSNELIQNNNGSRDLLTEQIQNQKRQIDSLEKKLLGLSQDMMLGQTKKESDHANIHQVSQLFRSLNIKESYIARLIKDANFELKENEMNDFETLFDFCLREVADSIKTELPLFSSIDLSQESIITVLLSETSSGQSSVASKLAVIQEDVDILMYGTQGEDLSFSRGLFDLNIIHVKSLAEIISACRKAQQEKRSVIIDVKDSSDNDNSAKSLVDSLKRTFKNIEVLVTASALHSESFNGKILSKYKSIANGVIITHVDMCLDFGGIFNVHLSHQDLPLKFFGTGPTIPEDIEAATSERIVASLFRL